MYDKKTLKKYTSLITPNRTFICIYKVIFNMILTMEIYQTSEKKLNKK